MTGHIALSIDELIKPTGEHIIMSSYSCNIPDGGNDMNWNIWNKSYYYINTNETPGELSRKNLISSRVKITYYLHVWKYHHCYGYIIDLAFHTKKIIKLNGNGSSLGTVVRNNCWEMAIMGREGVTDATSVWDKDWHVNIFKKPILLY